MSDMEHISEMYDSLWNDMEFNESAEAYRDQLKVFVMPHSHSDPGWLKTFDEYTRDTNKALDCMLAYLPTHKHMTFTWNEVSFFQRWWRSLSEANQTVTKRLISEGRFELTGGSWVMTDEASVSFFGTIDNIIQGHQFLFRELGMIPEVVLSNDPFGYSPSIQYLFSNAGLNKLVINRVHRSVKMFLERRKGLPFRWRQFWDTDGKSDVTTYPLPFSHYDIPNSCGPTNEICCQFDFRRLTHYSCQGPLPVRITKSNVKERAETLYQQYAMMASLYKAPVLLVLLGDDFRYWDMLEWEQQHDNYMLLFDYMNSRLDWNIKVRFGTFSDYFNELEKWQKGKNNEVAVLTGDFFPYNDHDADYWTGYFTTRPFYKLRERLLQSQIRAADILSALVYHTLSEDERLDQLKRLNDGRRELALFQHHDAITGTSKVKVMADYGARLFGALQKAHSVIIQSVSKLAKTEDSLRMNEAPLHFNSSSEIHTIHLAPGESIALTIFNSLPSSRLELIRINVNTAHIQVLQNGRTVAAQLNPVFDYYTGIIPDKFEVVFLLQLKAIGISRVVIRAMTEMPASTEAAKLEKMDDKDRVKIPAIFSSTSLQSRFGRFSIRNSRVKLNCDAETGLPISVEQELKRSTLNLTFHVYKETASGAYLFKPYGAAIDWPQEFVAIFVVRGSIQSNVHTFLSRIHHTTTLTESEGLLGSEILLNTLVDLKGIQSAELVIRLQTDFSVENRTFYTDSNGMQMLRRDARKALKVEANYYPMATAAALQSKDGRRLSVLAAHPHGVTSPAPGQLEIMLDRITIQDDGKGLGGGFDGLPRDLIPVNSALSLTLEGGSPNAQRPEHFLYHSSLAQASLNGLLHPPVVLQGVSSSSVQQQSASSDDELFALSADFPPDINLVTLRPLISSVEERLLILFRHGLDCNFELPAGSGEPDFQTALIALLKLLDVDQLLETNLSGVKAKGKRISSPFSAAATIAPQDLRTFKFRLK